MKKIELTLEKKSKKDLESLENWLKNEKLRAKVYQDVQKTKEDSMGAVETATLILEALTVGVPLVTAVIEAVKLWKKEKEVEYKVTIKNPEKGIEYEITAKSEEELKKVISGLTK